MMIPVWLTYTQWLQNFSQPQFSTLQPGTTDDEKDKLHAAFEFDLPEELIELYRINNGQIELPHLGPAMISMNFLDITNVIGHYNMWKELYFSELNPGETYGDYFNYENEGGKSFPEKAIKLKYINLKWIPLFHDGGGNHIGMDLDSDENGTYGQIINFGRDQKEKFVIAKSLPLFFQLMNTLISQNKLQYLKASENGFGPDAQFYLMSFENPLESDMISSLRKIIMNASGNVNSTN